MEFTQTIKEQALKRSNGKCECQRTTHSHTGRCNARFGMKWYVHPRSALRSKEDISLTNTEVLCAPCHEARQLLGVF